MIPSKHNSTSRIRWRRQHGAKPIGQWETVARILAKRPPKFALPSRSGFGPGRGILRGGTTKHKAKVTLPKLKFLDT